MVYTLSDLKHLETMAQLEEKELETPDVSILPPAQKDASFTSLLLGLCSKLRSQGFEKHASSLESKFLLFKQADAQTHLYKAHKETGEDLIESAHPDGDNKIISDMSNDLGDVETIVSRHKKIVDVLQKQPTGKLAAYVEQCKIALGVDENIDSLYQAANYNLERLRGFYDAIARKLGEHGVSNDKFFSAVQGILDKKDVYHTAKMEDFLINTLDDLKNDEEPGFFSSGEEQLKWRDEVLPIFEAAYKYAEAFRSAIAKIRKLETEAKVRGTKEQIAEYNEPEQQNTPSDPVQQLMNDMHNAVKSIDQHRAQVRAKNLPNANELVTWLDKAEKFGNDMIAEYSNLQNKADPKTHDLYAGQLKQLTDKIQGFATRWNV